MTKLASLIPPSGANKYEIAIIAAGIVRTYFQLASQKTCMKKRTTSIAFVHETAIMNAQPTCGSSRQGHNDE